MAANSNISWTDASWTPIRARNKETEKVGWHCEKVSGGCDHCYSGDYNEDRFGTGLPFKPGHLKDVDIFLDEKMLLAPLAWKKPRKIFVCSMTDLFGHWVPDEWIDKVFAVMALCPQHTFQILTKRSKRMRYYMTELKRDEAITGPMMEIIAEARKIMPSHLYNMTDWPLPNVHLGVSCEDQTRAEERIPDLLATSAAVRFVSAEPLLEELNLDEFVNPVKIYEGGFTADLDVTKLDWVICGGESGKERRPMQIEWADKLRLACDDGGTYFFFKQDNAHKPGQRGRASDDLWACKQFPKGNNT